jgi:hypothetical protein
MPKTSRNWIQWESCVGMNENPCNTHTYKKKTMHKNNTPQMKAKFCTLGTLHHPSKQSPLGYKSRPIHAHGWDKMVCVPLIKLNHMALCQVIACYNIFVGFGVKFGTSFKANCTSQYIYIHIEREREREREIALLVVVSLATMLVKTYQGWTQ